MGPEHFKELEQEALEGNFILLPLRKECLRSEPIDAQNSSPIVLHSYFPSFPVSRAIEPS